MSELSIPSRSEVSATITKLGYPETTKLTEVFPNYHPDRIVFRTIDSISGKDRVVKVRTDDLQSELEIEKVRGLVASYRFSGGHFDAVGVAKKLNRKVAIEMPYLGKSLSAMGQDMDLDRYDGNQDGFQGFSPKQIEELLKRLEADQMHFAYNYGLIHGDLIQPRFAPSNVVYNEQIKRLLLVDGEAMTLSTDEARAQFVEQLDSVREWMYLNLEVA